MKTRLLIDTPARLTDSSSVISPYANQKPSKIFDVAYKIGDRMSRDDYAASTSAINAVAEYFIDESEVCVGRMKWLDAACHRDTQIPWPAAR